MRDLAARLRDIVRQDRRTPHAPPAGELTYVADPDAREPVASAAEQLGGVPLAGGACVMVDRVYSGDLSHGRRRMGACLPSAGHPIRLFDERVSAVAEWWRRVVFFDIETTGLSGGAGTLAFLAGCGWFEGEDFKVRQFFLAGPSGERAMLEALAGVFGGASLLVTYNGRTFDVPFMETRWAFHRTTCPTDGLAHFDMLPPARRLWGRRDAPADDAGCSLSALERAVLGFHRVDDVPGFDIPARYFQFLRTERAEAVEGVLEHNRRDIQSLAVLMAHALWMAGEGIDACREAHEVLALGRIYDRAGEHDRAQEAYDRAARIGDAGTRRQALAHLAIRLRRAGRHEEAADRWQQVLDLGPAEGRGSALDRRAAEALAIHHEHRRKDMTMARRYTAALQQQAAGSFRRDVERRMNRIERKLRARDGRLADF
jgi:uncharacterized protein YprB with RNaseH-like and TPR domain